MPGIEIAIYYLIAVNLAVFLLFGWDKAQAQSGGWRISEDTLVGLVFFGGVLGALAGRAAFRHKTRKESFIAKMWVAAAANCAVVVGLWLSNPAGSASDDPHERARSGQAIGSVYYEGCNEVRAAGKAPLYYGEPGYRIGMDGDGDGIACEPHY